MAKVHVVSIIQEYCGVVHNRVPSLCFSCVLRHPPGQFPILLASSRV